MIYDNADIDTKVKLGKIFGTRVFLSKRANGLSESGVIGLERMLVLSLRVNRFYTLKEIRRMRRDN